MDLPLTGAALASLVELVEGGRITRTIARALFAEMVHRGGDPNHIVEERGLGQVSDSFLLQQLVEKVIAENEAKVVEYRNGRAGLFGFFVGQVMQQSGRKADPVLVKELLRSKLG